MAYSELIKNFERIRDYMRQFYVYGFKSRTEYDRKSLRSYDNERRRIESWLGDYMVFRQDAAGKAVFLAVDSRSISRNPLHKAFKAKSFTDGDITLHFILFDILNSPKTALPLQEITACMDRDYLACFETPMMFDESTVRKKLKEYALLGLVQTEKRGRQVLYRRTEGADLNPYRQVLSFFAEAGPGGVIGSFLLDRTEPERELFSFKHHYITGALESEILCALLDAMSRKQTVTITSCTRAGGGATQWLVAPLRIFVSVQNGREYLIGYNFRLSQFRSYRLDYITAVKPGAFSDRFDALRAALTARQAHMWGVVCARDERRTEHVEFTVHLDDGEEYIYRRLLREKRCGTVERVDAHTCRFTAEVYDTQEMAPWIRTFLCRIEQLNFSNRTVENQFRRDLEALYRMYGMEEEG